MRIMNRVSGVFNKVGFGFKKHSPEILVVVGVLGTVTSAVMACRATTKINTVLDKAKDDLQQIRDCMGNQRLQESGEYTQKDGQKDITIVYAKAGLGLAKLYTPAVTLGLLSLGCILTSNNMLRKRNVALAAAYASIDTSFKEYRNRVVDRLGKEIDHELRYNIKARQIEETVVDENGNETIVSRTINVADPNESSDYAKFFDKSSSYWETTHDYNLMFLRAQQAYANDKLRANGRLFLNDVYEMLDIRTTKAGQVVGWVYDPKNPIGDNYVDFGIYDTYRDRDSVKGYEQSILLDFNVDGNVWDLM